MSIKVTTAVWKKSRQAGGALLVLLALADFADDQGRAYPSIPTLAHRARLTDRQVRRILTTLVTSGELMIERHGGGRNLSNRYRVIVNGDARVRVSEVVNSDASDRVSEPSERSKPGHPRPETLTFATLNPDTHVSRSVMIRHEQLEAAPNGASLTPSAKLRTEKTRKHLIPYDFSLTPERRAVAERAGLDPEAFHAQFVDQCHAKGYVNANWNSAWSAWCRSESLKPKSPFKATRANTMQTTKEYWAKNS